MIYQTCRRHPKAGRFLAECSGCKQELFDIQAANERAAAERQAALAVRVRAALGLRVPQRPLRDGETATRVSVWSQMELNDVFERVGGTVASRQVERVDSTGEAWTATEITVTAQMSGIGQVVVFTDWYGEYGGLDLPVMRALAVSAAA